MTPAPAALLREMFAAAIAAAQPDRCVAANLPPPPAGRCVIVGAGKASAAMARVVEDHWRGRPLSGLVSTRYGHEVPCRQIDIVAAGHPIPDAAGEFAAERMLRAVSGLTARDLVLCLFSGGGSSLLPLPAPPLTLKDKQQLTQALLRSGAAISEVNCVRRHLSRIKGGKLAAACHPAQVVALLISDVPGDDPLDIASGPTVGDPSTPADALAVLERYAINAPAAAALLRSGKCESVRPDDPRLARASCRIIAAPLMALQAAASVARGHGVAAHILSDSLQGEARELGRTLAAIAIAVAEREEPFVPPCVLLSGGESAVTVRGSGRGGRNVECLLAAAIALNGRSGIHALAADTDGIDGTEEIAGACIGPDSLQQARALGMSAAEFLANNDAHAFFSALGASIVTGPTRTNVNDFRAILIEGA